MIEAEGGSPGGLLPWLRRDPVAKAATFSPVARPGEMGAGEIIQTVLEDAFALGGLVVAIAAWRDARRSPRQAEGPVVWVVKDGIKVAVPTSDPELLDRALRVLLEQDGSSEGPDPGASR